MKRFIIVIALLTIGAMFVVQSQQESPLYALPNANVRAYVSNTLALSDDGRTLVATNMLSNSMSIIAITDGQVLAEIPVELDPRSIALTPDNSRAIVSNRMSGTISIVDVIEQAVIASYPVGLLPYAVIAPTDTTAFVSLQGENAVVEVDLITGTILRYIETPASPSGLALWGDFLYVTHLWTGDVSLIYLPQSQVVRTVALGQDTGLSQSLVLDRTRGLAYLPQTHFNAQNTALTYDSLVFPVVNVLDLRDLGLQNDSRVTLSTADRPVNMPFVAQVDTVRNWLFVANAGSDDISVIELNTGVLLGHIEVGANPRGLLLSLNGGLLYAHNAIDGTVSIIETRGLVVNDVLPITNITIPVDLLIGAELFHTSTDDRLGTNNWISCATCHFDGQSDGRNWTGLADGTRNTPVLYDLFNTAPFTWAGVWDELADVELKVRELQAGIGLIDEDVYQSTGETHAGVSFDLDSLTAYLLTLAPPPQSPNVDEQNLITQGIDLFETLECSGCHAGDVYTDNASYDVGTGGEFNTPSLRWLWQSAPYLHDGRAETLNDVFTLAGAHQLIGDYSLAEIDTLVAYLLTLPNTNN